MKKIYYKWDGEDEYVLLGERDELAEKIIKLVDECVSEKEKELEESEKALSRAKEELKRLEGIEQLYRDEVTSHAETKQKYSKFEKNQGEGGGRKEGIYKCSEEDIEKMRQLRNSGKSYYEIGKLFNISEGTVRNYLKGRKKINKKNKSTEKIEKLRTDEIAEGLT